MYFKGNHLRPYAAAFVINKSWGTQSNAFEKYPTPPIRKLLSIFFSHSSNSLTSTSYTLKDSLYVTRKGENWLSRNCTRCSL